MSSSPEQQRRSPTDWAIAAAYHQRTKHHPQRYARSAGSLDWANQPYPFRLYEGADRILLPLETAAVSSTYDDLFRGGTVASCRLSLETLSSFFEMSLAISAWKQHGQSRWALRVNPSSGNLHPTEGYAIAPALPGLHDQPAVYHYDPLEHALERRSSISAAEWPQFAGASPPVLFCVALSSIHWREAWKYGERAYRYCQHDVGHALAALSIAAAAHGWTLLGCDGLGDQQVSALCGLDRTADYLRAEPECPALLGMVVPAAACPPTATAGAHAEALHQMALSFAGGEWRGQANRLSEHHLQWPVIDQAERACRKPVTAPRRNQPALHDHTAVTDPRRSHPAYQIVRQRRSAVSMDGRTHISRPQFLLMLERVLPRRGRLPWRALPPPVSVSLGLFVHRVEGMPPGLYCLVRSPEHHRGLRESMHAHFLWERPKDCPPELPLFLLQACDCRESARAVSCHQSIAGDGAFSVAMIAEFEAPLRRHGAWFYRRLFWETGVIGQLLYLEAEAADVRATGIGCFFDDAVHEVFGLEGAQYQSLYHLTVGGAVDDQRLTTLPAYNRRGDPAAPDCD